MATNALPDVIFKALKHQVTLFDLIKTNESHIALGNMWLFYYVLNKFIIVHFGYAKVSRILHLFYTQHRVWAVDYLMYIVFANGIAQGNKGLFAINNTPGKTNRMTNALPVCLMNKMRRELGIFVPDVILELITKITYN